MEILCGHARASVSATRRTSSTNISGHPLNLKHTLKSSYFPWILICSSVKKTTAVAPWVADHRTQPLHRLLPRSANVIIANKAYFWVSRASYLWPVTRNESRNVQYMPQCRVPLNPSSPFFHVHVVGWGRVPTAQSGRYLVIITHSVYSHHVTHQHPLSRTTHTWSECDASGSWRRGLSLPLSKGHLRLSVLGADQQTQVATLLLLLLLHLMCSCRQRFSHDWSLFILSRTITAALV